MQFSPEFKEKLFLLYHGNKLVIKLILIDQISKWWIISYLKQKPAMMAKVTSFFEIVYSWNHGISFGLFQHYYQYSNAAFLAINSAIAIYIWYLLSQCRLYWSFIGYSLIVGGAVGNLIDRFWRGAVFDFLHLHYHELSFPVFNLADSFISGGVALLIYDYYKVKKPIEEKVKAEYDRAVLEKEAKIALMDNDNKEV